MQQYELFDLVLCETDPDIGEQQVRAVWKDRGGHVTTLHPKMETVPKEKIVGRIKSL